MMDKLTKAFLDSKLKSAKKKSCSNQQENIDPATMLDMITNWSRDIEAEKESRKQKHIQEEEKRRKLRNKYRQKYGLDKTDGKTVKKERNSYILDPSSKSAIGIHEPRVSITPEDKFSETVRNARRMTLATENVRRNSNPAELKRRPQSTIGTRLGLPGFFQNGATNLLFGSSESLHSITGSKKSESGRQKSMNNVASDIKRTSEIRRHSSGNVTKSTDASRSSTANSHKLLTAANSKSSEAIVTNGGLEVHMYTPNLAVRDEPSSNLARRDSSSSPDLRVSNNNGDKEDKNSTKDNASWENNVLFRYIISPLFKKRSQSCLVTVENAPSETDAESDNGIMEDATTPEIRRNTYLSDQTTLSISRTPSPDFSEQSIDARIPPFIHVTGIERNCYSLKEGSASTSKNLRKGSVMSVRSSCTALSDPCELMTRTRNDVFDRARSTEHLSESDKTPPEKGFRKSGFKKFLQSVRRSDQGIKCVEKASRSPVYGDHSVTAANQCGDSEREQDLSNRTPTSKSVDSLIDGRGKESRESSKRSSDEIRRASTTSSTSSDHKVPLSCSADAAKRAERLYYQYMSHRGVTWEKGLYSDVTASYKSQLPSGSPLTVGLCLGSWDARYISKTCSMLRICSIPFVGQMLYHFSY